MTPFKDCQRPDQEVAMMALHDRAAVLAAKSRDLREAGYYLAADIAMGQHSACLAAAKALKEIAR